MKNVKVFGVDVGNDAVKIVFEDNRKKISNVTNEGKQKSAENLAAERMDNLKKLEIMNIIAEGYNRRIMGEDKSRLENLLDVTIYKADKKLGRYFVGGLAYKESRGDYIEKTEQDIKAESEDTIILLVTSIAYALFDEKDPVKTENVALGTLLPTEEFFNESKDLIEELRKKIVGQEYRVEFNLAQFNGAKITINFVDTEINPEGAAGTMAYTFTLDGDYANGMEKIEEEIHLGITIGSITTEVSIFDHGEFDPNGFFGIPLGTSNPLDKIIIELRRLGVKDMTRHKLDHLLRKDANKITVNVNGDIKDISEELEDIKEAKYAFFTKLLVNRINRELSTRGINTSFFNKVNMSGGGSISLIDNFKKEFKKGNIVLAKDARFANATGALVAMYLKLQDAEAAADEVLGG